MNITGHFETKFKFGGLTVATVTGNFTIHVNPPAQPPLTMTPNSGALPDETQGVDTAGTKVAVMSGGMPPYKVTNQQGMPPGVNASIDTDGVTVVLSGAPQSPGDANVAIDVSDSAPLSPTK